MKARSNQSGHRTALLFTACFALATFTGGNELRAQEVEVRFSSQAPMALSQWFIADKMGYFKEAGVKMTFTKFYPSGAPQVEGGLRGEWDLATMGGPPAITGGSRWGMLTIGLMAEEAGTHRMYVRKSDNINAANPGAQLKGKNVLATLGSAGHMMLESCLRSWNLGAQDVRLVPLQPPALVAAFTTGEGTLAQAYPPFSFQLERVGMVSICDTGKIGPNIYPVLAVTPKFAKDNPAVVARVIDAFFRANELFITQPEKMLPLINEYYAMAGVKESDDNTRLLLQQFKWLTLDQVHALMRDGEAKKSFEHMAQFFVRAGLLQRAPEVNFLGAELVAEAVKFRRSKGR